MLSSSLCDEQQNTFQKILFNSLCLSPGFVCTVSLTCQEWKSQMKISADVPVRRRGSRRSKKQNKKVGIFFSEFFNVKMAKVKKLRSIFFRQNSWEQREEREVDREPNKVLYLIFPHNLPVYVKWNQFLSLIQFSLSLYQSKLIFLPSDISIGKG